ncbi:MAG: hypothetical protein AB7K24_14710, partial [Gemmataceae bacterium]
MLEFTDKRAALREYTTAPMVCRSCGAVSDLTCTDEATRAALIEAAYRDELRDELDLLQRADRLFKRFPHSRHPVKVAREQLDPGPCPWVSDPEFARALLAERGRYDFLSSSSFYLPARLRCVLEQAAIMDRSPEPPRFECPACGFVPLRLDAACFERLG